jgi:hypothetical protein
MKFKFLWSISGFQKNEKIKENMKRNSVDDSSSLNLIDMQDPTVTSMIKRSNG